MATTAVIAGIGLLFAFLIIFRLKDSAREVRSMRRDVMGERSALQNARLAAILTAENAKLIGKGIDQGAMFLNAGHKAVSGLTYGILELFPATRGRSREIREKHMQITEGITQAFRAVNQHVGERIAEGIKNTRPAKKKKKPLRSLAQRRAKKKHS